MIFPLAGLGRAERGAAYADKILPSSVSAQTEVLDHILKADNFRIGGNLVFVEFIQAGHDLIEKTKIGIVHAQHLKPQGGMLFLQGQMRGGHTALVPANFIGHVDLLFSVSAAHQAGAATLRGCSPLRRHPGKGVSQVEEKRILPTQLSWSSAKPLRHVKTQKVPLTMCKT